MIDNLSARIKKILEDRWLGKQVTSLTPMMILADARHAGEQLLVSDGYPEDLAKLAMLGLDVETSGGDITITVSNR